jgi:hypothetical protein
MNRIAIFATLSVLMIADRPASAQYSAGNYNARGGYASDPYNHAGNRNDQGGYANFTNQRNFGPNNNGQGGFATTAVDTRYVGNRNGQGGLATFTAQTPSPGGLTYFPLTANTVPGPRSGNYFSFSNPPRATFELQPFSRPFGSTPPAAPALPPVPYWMR